jgi:hypothetical protein
VNPALKALLLKLPGIPEEELIAYVRNEYIRMYTDADTPSGRRGELTIHDGQTVVFYEDRFEHAFFTSAHKTSRKFNKDAFDWRRAARLPWIGEVLRGRVEQVAAWHLPTERKDPEGRPLTQRLYVLWEECYVIWLEPLIREGKWKFSSAYVEPRGRPYLRTLTAGGLCFWRQKNIP